MLASEEADSDEIQWIQPSNDDQEDSDNEDAAKRELRKQLRRQSSFDTSIKTGATRIMNPKNKKRMETCLVENDNSEGLQSILATETDDIDEQNWIQPGTTRDDDDTSEAPHNSILHDFKESISETLHHLHLPHHTKSEGAIKDKHGLLETAMETMLMEQANIMGAQSAPSADHVETVKFEEKRNSSIESFKKLLVAPFRRRSNDSHDLKPPKKETKKDKFSLFDSAMKTMLNETAHIIEGVGVHPKSIDKGDGDVEMENQTEISISKKIEEMKTESDHPQGSMDTAPEKDENTVVENKNPTQSYSNFCDNLNLSHVLTNDEPSCSSAAGNNNQSTNDVPTFVLTKCTSEQNKKKNAEIDPNTHIDKKVSLSPSSHDRVSIDNKKHSPKVMKKSINNINSNNNDNNLSKTLIHNHSGDLINQTNIAKLLAPDPYPKHRSHDEKSIPVNASDTKHTRADSYGTKMLTSPTKVPTSSSSYNTSTCVPAAANLSSSSSKGKDGKDAKETICRRSSDSDLSVTPKGKKISLIMVYPR